MTILNVSKALRAACAMSAILAIGLAAHTATAQSIITSGAASYASEPPAYKAATDEHAGFNASKMLSRRLYVDELPAIPSGGIDVPGRPIPTNDWWTDVLASRYSGALWSYPAMLRTSEDGVQINYPSYWADAGKELKSRTNINVGAFRWKADATIAADWHDWDVVLRMPNAEGSAQMRITAAHGSPFTWFEFGDDMTPTIRFSEAPVLFEESASRAGIRIGSDLYGLYFPQGARSRMVDGALQFDSGCPWLVVAILRTEADLAAFDSYATSVPRATSVSWNFDDNSSRLSTTWTVDAENLRDPSAEAPVMQGFLPHAYKYALPGADLSFDAGGSYLTPRGRLKMATSSSGEFGYSYRFSGMLPTFAPPAEGNTPNDGYDSRIMHELMQNYASAGSFGGDTYWGGKGLTQMALNMMFAKETGETEIYETSRKRLREAFENWLTYTPGENTFFFSYYPRWGAMLGFDVSYDSDAFNDHHFHYGYFTYAAALLCLEDADFAAMYGELLTLIAKDYANWDKTDKRFPFMRTLDPWCGHSWAGGMGDAGNDNGNGQESTSEAMQGWGGVYLLGVALGNKEMRDAGLFGWNTEARATREYWYDVDAPRTANAGGREPWAGKGNLSGNYNYEEYPYAYNSNITGKGIGWWTWFGGDPLFMHGIQWMPISPALDYLSWDTDFVAWAYRDLMSGANSSYSHKWFEPTANSDSGETIEPLALNDWGNVVLAYLQRTDPQLAASIFARAWREGLHIAKAVSTGHISYFATHSHLTWGEPDFSIYADIPTAQACVKGSDRIFMVYNPDERDRAVRFMDATGATIRTVQAPPRRLTVFTGPAHPASIEAISSEGDVLPPGSSTIISSRLLDQYGAAISGEPAELSLSAGAPASLNGTRLTINAAAKRGTTFDLTLHSGEIETSLSFVVNDRPEVQSARIEGLPDLLEAGTPLSLALITTDQYGTETVRTDASWTISDVNGGTSENISATFTPLRAGRFTISAAAPDAIASASIFITPPMPLISAAVTAIGSSAENGSCLPENVNDGNFSTRWGSTHTDDEWIMLDLGADCFISRVNINWEAAYAAAYDVEIAPDGCVITTHTGDYAGQTRTVNVPADGEWTSITPETASGPGIRETIVGARGRYVRIHGRRRATVWGYSIHELSIYGLDATTGPDDIVGIDFSLPPVADQHSFVALEPRAYTLSGNIREAEVKWNSDKAAEFAAGGFTPLDYGQYTITATSSGGIATSASVFVNESERVAGIELSATNLSIIEGESARLTATPLNQFGAPCRTYAGSGLEIAISDSDGQPTDKASYDPESGLFTSSTPGVYTVKFGPLAHATVNVLALRDANLALNKAATASSVRDGNKASFVNDGNVSTRWESDWSDKQWIAIDLEEKFEINRMEILWEGAYARQYRIEASTDGENWSEIHAVTNAKGGNEYIEFAPVAASRVRLCCDKRALETYGFSIYEWRVFGLRKIADTSGVENVSAGTRPEIFFDLQGRRLSAPPARGIYIRPDGSKTLGR
ncbi:MAG: discoidin domain-containing protein [Muribaculaceae bacterium]|nr:discoidin domain-containing protein [Muribaculaceae bacterium]